MVVQVLPQATQQQHTGGQGAPGAVFTAQQQVKRVVDDLHMGQRVMGLGLGQALGLGFRGLGLEMGFMRVWGGGIGH